MNAVINAIHHYAQTPNKIAVQGNNVSLSYSELALAIDQASQQISSGHVLGIAMDNDPAWAVIDLAAMALELPVVPLPGFFSHEQILHAISDAGIDCIVSDQAINTEQFLTKAGITIAAKNTYPVAGKILTQFNLQIEHKHTSASHSLPKHTQKVTYTSGTTGQPKGVCLDSETMLQVANALKTATRGCSADRHLSILPLSTLLENIAGLYVPLLSGAICHLLPMSETGLSGGSGLDIQKMMLALHISKATTTILTPELLRAMIMAIQAGMPTPTQLRFIAVGGASVSPHLLDQAASMGLAVYEGYGLSECASVLALNTPEQQQKGSVGKPLPHAQIKIADDGEILVQGATMAGYTGEAPRAKSNWLATGDIGYFDENGFLYISGRKKNVFITSFGRNVSPEWVERELCMVPAISQAIVFGEARPWNVALIVPGKDSQGNFAQIEEIDSAIMQINAGLPDYAQIRQWLFAEAPFTRQNQQLTSNGRLRREAIWQQYAPAINRIYEEAEHAVL